MVLGSCYSFQGKSHKVSDTVCQDASIVKEIVGDWTVMAIADGVGSCTKSDIGSKIAVETASELCVQAFPVDGNEKAILSLMQTAFNHAMRKIAKTAKENQDDVSDYDTTLDLVIFNGSNKLYYGHCGDGGIYVLNSSGVYTEITEVQEGEEASSVVPLRNGNTSWKFGVFEDEIAVVAAFTDGIRDKLTSPLLRDEVCKIDVPLANKFMFVDVYGMTESEATAELKRSMKTSAVYLHSKECKITDDITMGILVNTSVLIREDPCEKYQAPDWSNIWYSVIERLYPDHDVTKQVTRRHKLMCYFSENQDKITLSEGEQEQILDKYYPLTEQEKEEYAEKYHKSAATKPVSQSEISETDDTETMPDYVDSSSHLFGKMANLIKGVGKALNLSDSGQLPATEQPDNQISETAQNNTEESLTDIQKKISAEELDVPIIDEKATLSERKDAVSQIRSELHEEETYPDSNKNEVETEQSSPDSDTTE